MIPTHTPKPYSLWSILKLPSFGPETAILTEVFMVFLSPCCLLWNPKVHYCVHKRPSPVPMLSHMNPINTLLLDFLKIHFNVRLLRLGLQTLLFSSGFLIESSYAYYAPPCMLRASPTILIMLQNGIRAGYDSLSTIRYDNVVFRSVIRDSCVVS
jgi:hypothetical protein